MPNRAPQPEEPSPGRALRTARPVSVPESLWVAPDPASAGVAGRPVIEACHWLYLASDPATRADHVTDGHRCELQLDSAPDPGHQLAYCLSANCLSCPYVRSRRIPQPLAQPTAPAPAAQRAETIGGAVAAESAPSKANGRLASRWGWVAAAAAAGLAALAALGIVLSAAPAVNLDAQSETQNAPVVDTAGAGVAAPVSAPVATITTGAIALAAPAPAAPLVEPFVQPIDLIAPIFPASEEAAAGAATATAVASAEATEQPEPGLAPEFERYTVESGDSLLLIAVRLDVTIDALLEANDLQIDSLILPGDQLIIP